MTITQNTIEKSAASATNQVPSRILVMGPQASAFASALLRLNGNSEIFHAETAAEAIKALDDNQFDHVLVDNRTDGALTLTIPRLAQLQNVNRITVLAGPKSAEQISAIPGIGQVITPPYNPVEIATSLGIDIKDSRKSEDPQNTLGRRAEDDETTLVSPLEAATASEEIDEDINETPKFIMVLRAIVNFIPGLTPILSALYKNTALTILAALFVAFVSYGIMIAFFLTSGDWSSPLQLQVGHELVVKAETESNELQIKRNLLTQQIVEAKNRANEARAALSRADTLADLTIGIINQEIANHGDNIEDFKLELVTLKEVMKGYGERDQRIKDLQSLKRDYKNRVISRQTYQAALLGAAQMERQVAELRSEITAKGTMVKTIDQSLAYLNSLKSQLADENSVIVGSGQAAYVPLTNQIIEVRQTRASAKSTLDSSEQSIPSLENSLAVVTKGLDTLHASPMIAALEKPVNVLFVPYDNIDSYSKGQPLYACAVALFWCTRVGDTGEAIGGEISTTHPFFGKPIRGQFVEAILTDPTAAKKDIIHVGRPPFFF